MATMTQKTSSSSDVTATSPFILTLLTAPGSAAIRIENRELPSAIQVDDTAHREVAKCLGTGVEVYDCNPDAGTVKFREPQADLYDLETLTQRSIYFVGPEPRTKQWADADGSRVVALVDASPPAEPTKDVLWLKVESFQNFGPGVFGEVGPPSHACWF